MSFTIEPGQTLCLVGRGCGKSTTGRMAAGLLEPSQGRVLYGDKEVEVLPGGRKDAFGGRSRSSTRTLRFIEPDTQRNPDPERALAALQAREVALRTTKQAPRVAGDGWADASRGVHVQASPPALWRAAAACLRRQGAHRRPRVHRGRRACLDGGRLAAHRAAQHVAGVAEGARWHSCS